MSGGQSFGDNPEELAKFLKEQDKLSGINRNINEPSKEEVKEKKPSDLGNINDYDEIAKEEFKAKKTLEEAMGYTKINLEDLPTKGLFYPVGAKMLVRALKVDEIKHWSSIDETDLVDVYMHLNKIVLSACKFTTNDNKNLGHYSICDADRLYLLLKIRDKTFKQGESKIDIPAPCQCATGADNKIPLRYENIVINNKLPEKLEKYYNEEKRCFIVETKSYGNLTLHLPRIGVMERIYGQVADLQRQNKPFKKEFYVTLPYIITNHRLLDKEDTFNKLYGDFQSWDTKKYSIYTNLINKLQMGATNEIKGSCPCGSEVTAPLEFPDGIKSLFFISNIDDELL